MCERGPAAAPGCHLGGPEEEGRQQVRATLGRQKRSQPVFGFPRSKQCIATGRVLNMQAALCTQQLTIPVRDTHDD